MNINETRAGGRGLELREADSGDGYTLTGYASVFDAPYEVNDFLGSYLETIRPGAFTRTLNANADVRLLVNHDGLPLARTRSGTLSLSQDDHGLKVQARLDPQSPVVATVKSAMDRGDLDEMSFAFSATRQEWSADYSARDITEARLFDVSLVTYPANPAAGASLRSAATARGFNWGLALAQVRAGQLEPDTAQMLAQLLGAIGVAEEAVCTVKEALADAIGAPAQDDEEPVQGEPVQSEPEPRSWSPRLLNLAAALDT